MTSPTKDCSIDGPRGSPKINNPTPSGLGSSSSSPPADTAQENETLTPTSTEVQPSQTSPLSPAPPLTSSGGVFEITSDHVIDHPPPPLFIPPNTTSSVGSSSGRKRGRPRKEHCGGGESSSSSTPTPRNNKLRRGDHHEEAPPIKCVVCGREFCSDKAYFGHLRKHPDRQWRGAYPPPEVEKLGPTLLELANQTIARMSGSGSSYSSSRGSLGINLNINPSIPPPPPPPPRRDDGGALPFDLNMPPPPENDEEEEENPEHARHHNHSDI